MFQFFRRALLFIVGFTMPIQSLGGTTIFGYPATPAKISTALLLLFAIVSWPLTGRALPWNHKHPWVIAFAASLGISAGYSIVQGTDPGALILILVSFAAVITFYFLVPYVIESHRDLRVLASALALGAVVCVVVGIASPSEVQTTTGRFTGSAESPNGTAYVLNSVLPFFFVLAFTTRSRLRALLLWGVITLSIGGIVLTLSRSAFLAMVLMFVLWMIRFGRLDMIRYAVPAVAIAVLVLLLAPDSFRDRMGTIRPDRQDEDHSIQMRYIMGYWALRAFASNPILGVGFERTGAFANRRDSRIGRGHAVHNAYMKMAADSGLMGLIPLLAITVLTWRDYGMVWRTARRHRGDPVFSHLYAWAIFLQIAFLGQIVGAQFHVAQRTKEMWLIVGLSSALVNLAAARARELSRAQQDEAAPEEPRNIAAYAPLAPPVEPLAQ